MPRVPGTLDVITQPLYDSELVLAAGTTTLRFFATPKGQAAKSALHTNMELAGQLPSPWTFEIRGFAFKVANTTTPADVKEITDTGWFQLTIGSKDFGVFPLQLIGGGAGLAGFSATTVAATTLDAVSNGTPNPSSIYILTKPITILENENFNVTATWEPAVTPAVNTRVYFVLHGELTRGVQ